MRSQIARDLEGLSQSDMVTSVLDRAISGAQNGEPLQTGRVLDAVFEVYSTGQWASIWSSIWSSYSGTADAMLASAVDTRSHAAAQSWHGIPVSRDLLVSLLLLARMTRQYKMDPIPPGAMPLALVLNPGTGASRYLCKLSGSTHAEMLDRIQSGLLGVEIEGIDDLTALAGAELERRHGPLRWALGLFCWWVAWLVISAVFGWATGAALTIGTVVCTLVFTRIQPLSQGGRQRRSGRPRIWRMPNFGSPVILIALLILVLFAVTGIVKRHTEPTLFVPHLVVSGFAVIIILAVDGYTYAYLVPRNAARPFIPGFSYRAALATSVALTLISALLAWYTRLAMLAVPVVPYGARLTLSGRVVYWLRTSFTESYFGASLAHAYWPLLAAACGAACGYFCGLASQILLTRITNSAVRWIGVSCAGGVAVLALNYLPLPAKPALYVNTIFTPGALYKYPTGPSSIGLNNHDSIAHLQWMAGEHGSLIATGILYEDNCSPDCASGTYNTYPVRIIATAPRRCNILIYPQDVSVPLTVEAVIYATLDIIALKSGAPPYETGYSILSVSCG